MMNLKQRTAIQPYSDNEWLANANKIKSVIDFWAGSYNGQYNTYALARLYASSPYMYTAGNIRAQAVSRVRFKAFEGETELPEVHPLSRLIHPTFSFIDMMKRNELALSFFGWSLDYIQKTTTQRPYKLMYVNPTVITRSDYSGHGLEGWYINETSDTGVDVVEAMDGGSYIPYERGLYFNEVDFFDDYDGVSPAEATFLSVMASVEVDETTLAIFRNGAVPAMAIQPTADAKDDLLISNTSNDPMETLRNTLKRWFKGSKNQGKILTSSTRYEYHHLQPPFKDLDTSAVDNMLAEKIAAGFQVPLSLIMPSKVASGLSRNETNIDWAYSWISPRVQWYASKMTERIAQEYYGKDFSIRVDETTIPFLQPTIEETVNIVTSKVNLGTKSFQDAQLETDGKVDELVGDEPLYKVGNDWVKASMLAEWARYKLIIAQSTTLAGAIEGDNIPFDSQATEQAFAEAEAQAELDRAEAQLLEAETEQTEEETEQVADSGPTKSRNVSYDQFKELETYFEFIRRKGFTKAKDSFTFEHVPQDIVRYIENNYDPDNKDVNTLQNARQRMSIKAISSVRSDAESDYRRLLERAQAENMPESTFRERFRTTIGVYIERAYEAGLIEGGVTDGALTQDDLDTIRSLKLSMTPIVRRLARDIYSDDGISDDEIARKPRMWINGTVNPAFSRGLDSARYNPMMQWYLGNTEEHCGTCQKLDGQRHRRNIWRRHNLESPPRVGQATDCGGYQCECELRVVSGRARGRIKSALEACELHHADGEKVLWAKG